MGSDESERVLALLKELSVLKEQDSKSDGDSATDSERDARRLRQQEIAEEIKALAEEKKKEKNPD
jgi:hypothetical protein